MQPLKNKIALNLIGQVASFIVTLGISFFLTPYIVDNLSSEVYGFVGLANNFVSYITLFTVAISGMLSRYVTVEYSKKNYEMASGYFSTAIISQAAIALALSVPMLLFASRLDVFINISPENVPDVRVLWILIFLSFLLGLPMGSFGIASFVKNRLDISALISIIGNVLRAAILLITFLFFTPKVWYIGLASIASHTVSIILNYWQSRKLMPEVKIGFSYFNIKYIYKLLIVGIWNSLNKLQQILVSGLDLLLTNLFISPGEMGILSVAKTLPTQISTLISTVSSSCDPTMTISYAKEDKSEFLENVKFAMKLSGFLCSVPIIGIIVFGMDFYRLWMDSLTDSEILKIQILAVLTMLPQVFSVYIFPLYTVNTITCKLKVPVLLSIAIGFANVGIVLALLSYTNLGVYAVAGVSSVLWVLRIFLFVPSYAAHIVDVKRSTFYGPLLRGVINIAVTGGVLFLCSRIFNIDSWFELFAVCIPCGILGYAICFMIMFEKRERRQVFSIIRRKLKKRG